MRRRSPAPGSPGSLDALRDALRRFAAARDWDQFHSPKNLAMALAVEAAELMEHFQWLDAAGSAKLPRRARAAVAEEMADVLLYLVRLADRLEVDLAAAARAKMRKNARRYPAARVRGSSRKYTAYRRAARRRSRRGQAR